MLFDPQAASITQSTAVPLGTSDIACHAGLNTVITASPQIGGYGAIQFWDADSGELLRSEMVFMDKRPGEDWILTSRPDSSRVALTSGSLMKVWVIMSPAYVKSIRSERHRKGMGGSNFAFFDQPWHAFRVIEGANGYRMEGIDLRLGEGADAATNSAPVPVPNGVLEASINGRFFASHDATTRSLTIHESRDGVFNPFQQFENCGSMQSQCPSPDGNSVWRSQHFFTALNKQRFIKLERERYASEDFSKTSTAWVGNTHVVEIVSTVASNESDPAPQKVMVLWSINQTKALSEIAAPDAYAVCASPDGTQIAEAGEDMKLRIRNGSTLAIERELRVHDGTVKCVAWNPKLPLIATTSSDHTLKIWDLRTDRQVAYYSLLEGIPDKICWSPDGSVGVVVAHVPTFHMFHVSRFVVCHTDGPDSLLLPAARKFRQGQQQDSLEQSSLLFSFSGLVSNNKYHAPNYFQAPSSPRLKRGHVWLRKKDRANQRPARTLPGRFKRPLREGASGRAGLCIRLDEGIRGDGHVWSP